MTIEDAATKGIPIDGLGPVLKGSTLIAESESLPPVVTDLGGGVIFERRGQVVKLIGGENMSPQAKMAALRAGEIGGDAGRSLFESYRSLHPAEFDGSRTFKAMLALADPPPPPPPSGGVSKPIEVANDADYTAGETAVTVRAGHRITAKGSAEADFIEALNDATVWGLGGNDVISAQRWAVIDGGEGDDTLSAYDGSVINGGDGNDVISAYQGATIDGGRGNDVVTAYDAAKVTDLDGNNYVSVGTDSMIATGDGIDWIEAGNFAQVKAGGGTNLISAGSNSAVTGGDGVDHIKVGSGSEVWAGAGDDRITVDGGATIHFHQGDGNDIVDGGAWGQAYRETTRLSSSVLSFGPGISADDLGIQRQGNDIVISVGIGDSVTLKDALRHGVPTLSFADGTAITSADLNSMAGPADEYQPASTVMQNWINACSAYKPVGAQGAPGAKATASA